MAGAPVLRSCPAAHPPCSRHLPIHAPPACSRSAVERRSASALALQKPYGQPASGLQPGATRLQQQQHRIRQTGLGPFGNTTFGSV